ncbi:DUF305 domain-containing protein [Blastococcus saxobsidens]|uniref:Uncharacterized protein (DUF305 family) n=1 Tax=Blastococcus saxobsidens TaxID=138336 RepID=A0A4Q7Y2S0_9ACTN|nr:DUF305 domain-containing protein [Blastococcus saxobsidens]RZU30808.1 uncharacterized protein (DUF305 family) [Blastococcus saxobsidens]
MTRTTTRLTQLATALVAGTLVLSACGDDTTAGHDSMGSSDTSASAESSAEADFSDADVTFAAGMVPHHQSAIEMAQLAEGRAADPRVLDLAARIEAAQGPEIETLSGWLEQWGADGGTGMDHGGMDHGSDGMMSEQDMQALMNATGADFDRMFLSQMIVHHTGAVEMAEAVLSSGRNTDALAMAGAIRDSQSAEIAEMEQLLAELGG